MPEFRPFRGLRYDLATAAAPLDSLVAPPYDVVDEDQRAQLARRDPHNAVRLILPDGDDPYAAAAADLASWQAAGILRADDRPSFTIYSMVSPGTGGRPARRTRGVIGALGITETGQILPHERTLPKAKSDRLALLRATRANLDPIWGLSLATGLTDALPAAAPTAVCTDDDGVRHEIAVVSDGADVAAIRELVESASIVLADGHHRFETARTFFAETGAAGADAIMTFVVELSERQLDIQPIHRLLRGLPSEPSPRAALSEGFTITDAGPNTPEAVRALVGAMHDEAGIGLVVHDRLALARPRPEAASAALAEEPSPVAGTDAALVEHLALPALAPESVTYRDDAVAVAALVAKGSADAAVLLRAPTVATTRAAAAEGVRMPQKTTFFWPKPRTGPVFRLLDLDPGGTR